MANNYHQKRKERLIKEARERYRNFYEEKKEERYEEDRY